MAQTRRALKVASKGASVFADMGGGRTGSASSVDETSGHEIAARATVWVLDNDGEAVVAAVSTAAAGGLAAAAEASHPLGGTCGWPSVLAVGGTRGAQMSSCKAFCLKSTLHSLVPTGGFTVVRRATGQRQS